MDQLNNEIKKNWCITNIDETKVFPIFYFPIYEILIFASSHHWNNVKLLIFGSCGNNFTTLHWNFSLNRTTTWRVLIRPTERSSIGLPPCWPHPKSTERLGTIDSWACGSSTTTDPVRSIADEWATLNRTEWNYDLFIVRVKACCNSCKGVGSGKDLT